MAIRTAQDLIADASARVSTISAQDAVELAGRPVAAFVDIREGNELEKTGTVAGAVHVPRGLLEFQADPASPSYNAALDPAKRIVIFCASGRRSTLAARTLQKMGFSDVVSVEGGFSALQAAGMPTKGS